MTSALSPRDIQSRIRAGARLEDVAAEAGVEADKVEPFAAPVLAEREHVAGTALQCPVRRRGESSSARSLRATVEENLLEQGVDAEAVAWDAWREEDRSWTVQGTWSQEEEQHGALFKFDQKARFSLARNDDARRLIGEALPGEVRPRDVDAEPTIDLNDELALVRAVQGDAPIVDEELAMQMLADADADAEDETIRLPRPTPQQVAERDEPVTAPTAGADNPIAAPKPAVELEDVDDYSEVELEQVDGVYDIVPKSIGEMDVLYEMLSSFNEDSVNIYAGLTDPIAPQAQEPRGAAVDIDEAVEASGAGEPAAEVVEEPVAGSSAAEESAAEPLDEVEDERIEAVDPESGDADEQDLDEDSTGDLPDLTAVVLPGASQDADSPDSPDLPDSPDSPDSPASPNSPTEDDEEADPEDEPSEDAEAAVPAEATDPAAIAAQASDLEADLEQDHLEGMTDAEVAVEHKIEDEDVETSAPEPAEAPDALELDPLELDPLEQDALIDSPEPLKPAAKKRSRSKRASVPSWDEIMFGSPMPGQKG